jgi:hypothetical protein
MTHDAHEPEDLFQRADVHDRIDPAFQADLRRRMLATFQQARQRGGRSQRLRRYVRIGLGVGIAAGLVLPAVGRFASRPATTLPDLSFAAVQQRVEQMNAVQYRQTVTVAPPGQPADTVTADVVNVDAPQWQVVQPDGQVLHFGSAGSAAPEVQFASDRPVGTADASTQSSGQILRVLDELRSAKQESVTSSGLRRVINNRPAVSFCIDRPQRTTEVWVDTQTQLPVLVQDVPADKSGSVTASDLYWIPRDGRGGTILNLRTRSIPPAAGKTSEGKILVVPTGGNVDHMPMMAIPEGCKILIPGTSNGGSEPPARLREEAQTRRYKQRLQEEIQRQRSAGTQASASQTRPSAADVVVRAIAVHGDPEFVVARLQRVFDAYGGQAAPKIVAVVPATDGHMIIVKGTEEQVEHAAELARWLDLDSIRFRKRATATSASRPPPSTQPSASQTEPRPANLVVRVVEVHADPTKMAAILQVLFERQYGRQLALKITGVPSEEGRFIIIEGRQGQVDRAVRVVESLDQPLRTHEHSY